MNVKLHNNIGANHATSPPEGLYLIAQSNTVEAITADATLYFTKLWLYQAKAVTAGVLTDNTATIRLGKSGAAGQVTLASLRVTAGVALATKTAHGFLNGQSIVHAGATPSALNGNWVIYEATPDTYKFRSNTTTAFTDGPASGTITATRTQYLPWTLVAGDTYGMVFEMPLGQRMRVSEIIIYGTATDGVFYSFT